MQSNRTFTIIKPDAVAANNVGNILAHITSFDFKIKALRMVEPSYALAYSFYAEHVGRPYFKPLITFMTSGPVVVAVLEKENAVADYRKLMGATKVDERAEGTIRKIFGTGLMENAVHGSDSEVSAAREIDFFFVPADIF